MAREARISRAALLVQKGTFPVGDVSERSPKNDGSGRHVHARSAPVWDKFRGDRQRKLQADALMKMATD
jgi:hypothetical protein